MTRRITLSVVWAYAMLVWGSIAHTFLGIPDIGLLLALAVVAALVLLPLIRTRPIRAQALSPARSRVHLWFQADPAADK
jgi:hypothetical protein